MLLEIKELFQTQPTWSLDALSKELHSDHNTVRDMIKIWTKKGKLKEVSFCSGCQKCPNAEEQYFQWQYCTKHIPTTTPPCP